MRRLTLGPSGLPGGDLPRSPATVGSLAFPLACEVPLQLVQRTHHLCARFAVRSRQVVGREKRLLPVDRSDRLPEIGMVRSKRRDGDHAHSLEKGDARIQFLARELAVLYN